MDLYGDFGKAIVYTDEIEDEAIAQIILLLNQPMAENTNIRIMPDVHSGAGCVIGYTAELNDKVVPNLIGVDINCGVAGWKIGTLSKIGKNFDKLDEIIKNKIPSGRNVNEEIDLAWIEDIYNQMGASIPFNTYLRDVKSVCEKTGQDYNYVLRSLGTLGGGNHFLEIDQDVDDYLWLIIHSGSRNFGLKIAKYHQNIAEKSLISTSKEFAKRINKIKKTKKGKEIEVAIRALHKESFKRKATGLEYLSGDKAEDYFADMKVAQVYAKLNRRLMADKILTSMYGIDFFEPVESVHNYINFTDNILRKGAISAHKGEEVIIPLNMAEGVIYGIGKGNKDWNYSAPHGSGRLMSRNKAKANIKLEDFQNKMKKAGVWSSCVGESTLDESPQAYKNADKIIEYLADTVDIVCRMKPVYNFKASE